MNWQKLYEHLTNSGFEVYSLGQKRGECNKPYLVLRNNGTKTKGSGAKREYEILAYVPQSKYSIMEDYLDSIKQAMQKLFPTVKLTNDESTHYLDNDVKAYMASLEYAAPKVADYVGHLISN